MSAKKCCCCCLLTRFPCFSDKKSTLSAQPDSSEIASPPLTVITNPSPAATISSAPSHQLSSSAPPSAAVPSQVSASTVMQNASQPIAPSDAVPSSSRGIVTPSALIPTTSQTTASPPTQPASSSTPSSLIPTASQTTASPPTQPASSSTPSSSRLPKESDYAETIMEAAKELDNENVDGDFSDLINYISRLFDFIEEKEKEKEKKKKGNSPSKPEATRNYCPDSKFFYALKDVLAEGIEGIKEVPTGDAKTIALDLVKQAGMVHLVTAGFNVVANILERYEAISTNKGACLSLLREMDKLARHVNKLRKRPELKGSMEDSIREAIALIVEASLACCTQINATKFKKFFSTTVNGEELARFKTRLAQTDTHIQRNFHLCLYDAIVHRQKHPEHPKDAVGIEKQLEKVIELLECGSDKNAVAVILHGFGGMGKTTLADAVFARLFDANKEGYKYSKVRLFDDIASRPDILKWQTMIIEDLKGDDPYEIRSYDGGQKQIESILEKAIVFIYIDNVLLPDKRERGPDALTRLLPNNVANAKKLRLLITTRNKDAASWMTTSEGVEKKFYPIQSLPEAEAEALLKRELNGNEIQLNASQIDGIVKICGGVQALLKVLAGFINDGEGNAVQNYEKLVLAGFINDGEGNAVQNCEKMKKEAEEKKWDADIGVGTITHLHADSQLEHGITCKVSFA